MSNISIIKSNTNNSKTRTNTNMRTTPEISQSQNVLQTSQISIRSGIFFEDTEQISETFDRLDYKVYAADLSNQQRITSENFPAFCEQMRRVLQSIKTIQDITYSLPSQLQENLDEEAKELDCLYHEIREATNNIERIKTQRKAVRKEKYTAEKVLKKLKDEETKEMEMLISIYDKGTFARWEMIKNSTKLEVVENFLSDIEGKLSAMKHLKTLATQQMDKVIKWKIKESTEKKIKRYHKESKRNANDNKNTSVIASSSVMEHEAVKRRRQQRLSKIDLPTTESVNSTTSRMAMYSTLLHIPEDDLNSNSSHDSARPVELNTEMDSVFPQQFVFPNIHFGRPLIDMFDLNTPTNNTITNTTAINSIQSSPITDNRRIHIFLPQINEN